MRYPVRNIVLALLLLFMADGKLRAQTATTSAATGVTDIAATFNGTIDAGGGSWYLYFQWGTTTLYGNSIAANPFSAFGSTVSAETVPASGLLPNTTYHYRLVAELPVSGAPTLFGQDMTFTTGPPSTPPTLNGNVGIYDLEKTQAIIQIPTISAGGAAATVVLEYGTSTAYGSTQSVGTGIAAGATASFAYPTLQGLTPGTTYHAHCKVTSTLGTAVSPDFVFTTKALEVVTTGVATNVTDLTAYLNGSIIPNGNFFAVYVEYGTTTSYGESLETPETGYSPQMVAMGVSDLQPNTLYHYRLAVYDVDDSAYYYGADQTFTTGPPATPPLVVGNVTVSNVGPMSASVFDGGVSSGSSPATVVFQYGTSTAYGSSVQVATLATNTGSVETTTLTGLQPNTTYHVCCTATNAQGSTSSPDTTFTTPNAPTVVTTAATGVTDLNAVFNGTVNPNGLYVSVEFEFGTSSTDYTEVVYPAGADLSGNSTYAETGTPQDLLPNTTYHYRIVAVDSNNVAYYGADMTFTTAPPATPPTAGTLTVDLVGTTQAEVICTPVSAGSSPATVYFDYGLTTAYGSTITWPSGPLPTRATGVYTQDFLTGLSLLTTYHVRCRVVNGEGTSTSADVTFTTYGIPAVTTNPATNVTDLTATLNGSVIPNGFSTTGYLYFDIGPDTNYGSTLNANPSSVLSSALTPFSLALLNVYPNTTYHYRAWVYYPFTASVYYGADQTFTTGAPATPPTVSSASTSYVSDTAASVQAATVFAGSSDATVIWEFGATTAYGSSVASNPPIIYVGSTGSASAVITGLTPGTTYHYRCTATNGQGSASSADGTFTTNNAPVLTTSPLYTATDLTATLNGAVTLNGDNFSGFYFEWGADTTYGSQASATASGIGDPETISGTVAGLLPNTTYHYRLKGETTDGVWYYGQDQTLTTGPPNTPPTVSTGSATTLTTTSVSLNVYSLETGSSAATLSYDYGADTTYGTTVVYPTSLPPSQTFNIFNNSLPVTITGLTPGTTYHFRARAANNEGSSVGQDVSFTTAAAPTVTTTAATNVSTVCATLNGTFVGNGVTYTASFDYGPDTTYGTNVPAIVPFVVGGGGGGIIINAGTAGTVGLVKVGTGTALTTGITNTFGAVGTTGGGTITVLNAGTGTVNVGGTILNVGTLTNPVIIGGSSGFTTGSGEVISLLDWGTVSSGAIFTSSSTTTTGTTITTATPDDSGSSTLTLPVLGAGAQHNLDGGIIISGGGGGGIIIGGNPNAPINTFASINGLTPNTTYHYRLKVTDSAGNSFYGADMTFTTIGPDAIAQNWRQSYFSTPDDSGAAADLANPSGDGIPNLLKYALGLNPTFSSSSSIPQPVLKTYDGLTYLDITFQRDSSMTDLTYAVQGADSPAGPWTTIASSVGGAPTTGPGFVTENPGIGIGIIEFSFVPITTYTVEVHDIVSTGDAPRRFLRLQVTRQ